MIKTSGLSKLSIFMPHHIIHLAEKTIHYHGVFGGSGKAFANLSKEPFGTSMLAAWAL